MVKPVLSVKDLTVAFKRRGNWNTVTHDISFDIGPKETVALVGESGSGKSVTAMSIMRLYQGDGVRMSGSVTLDGQELLTLPKAEMTRIRGARIGMIFQEPMTSLNPVMTAGRQIAESLVAHKGMSHAEAKAETIRLLDRVRIPASKARYDEYPHQFSGGMRQRVMIAMALACKPRLLIADEPTTALDVTIQAQILDLIKTLQDEEGMSVLFITHDMGVVAEIADRTVVMYKGNGVEAGDTADIFNNPQRPYTRALLSAVPRLGSMTGEAMPRRFDIIDPVDGRVRQAAESVDTVSADAKPVLEVQNLTTRFAIRSGLLGSVTGRVHAVENVSFTLKQGETLSLVGESGCGKSTTGLSVLRLLTANSGSVKLDGEELTGLSPDQLRARRRSMQMIFQDPFASLNPRMTVGETVAEPMLVHGLADPKTAPARVAELLRRVGLSPDMASRYPHEFSGGQRQRICIARALAVEPKLIVAESVSALDVAIKAQVVNLLLDLQESMKLSYLFISHDMAVVERVSHRVAVMYLGEIVEIGPRAEIFGNPQHPYTKKLLAAVPVADPSRRGQRHNLPDDEIKSPVRPANFQPLKREYRQVSAGHSVQVWGEEWAAV
jgi:peptide/nickel transport system ATP-binding protein